MSTSSRPRFTKAYSFGLVTGLFFLLSWAAQFIFQMMEVRNEAQQHGQQFTWSDFFPQFFQSTFENWQSEFLQLIWQAAGLALFYYWGSSQSKEGDDRLEAKVDALLRERGIDPEELNTRVVESADS
jgi:ferric iron reductase protein FhuF